MNQPTLRGLLALQKRAECRISDGRPFNVESGIIATWVKNVGEENLTEAFPYRPELVGQAPPQIVLCAILKTARSKRALDDDEFLGIVGKVIPND